MNSSRIPVPNVYHNGQSHKQRTYTSGMEESSGARAVATTINSSSFNKCRLPLPDTHIARYRCVRVSPVAGTGTGEKHHVPHNRGNKRTGPYNTKEVKEGSRRTQRVNFLGTGPTGAVQEPISRFEISTAPLKNPVPAPRKICVKTYYSQAHSGWIYKRRDGIIANPTRKNNEKRGTPLQRLPIIPAPNSITGTETNPAHSAVKYQTATKYPMGQSDLGGLGTEGAVRASLSGQPVPVIESQQSSTDTDTIELVTPELSTVVALSVPPGRVTQDTRTRTVPVQSTQGHQSSRYIHIDTVRVNQAQDIVIIMQHKLEQPPGQLVIVANRETPYPILTLTDMSDDEAPEDEPDGFHEWIKGKWDYIRYCPTKQSVSPEVGWLMEGE